MMANLYSISRTAIFGFVAAMLTAGAPASARYEAELGNVATASEKEEHLVAKVGGPGCTGAGRVSVKCDIQYNTNCPTFTVEADLNCRF